MSFEYLTKSLTLLSSLKSSININYNDFQMKCFLQKEDALDKSTANRDGKDTGIFWEST